MMIAVTGALGFIGHELVDRLIKDGHEVIAVDYCQDLIRLYEKARIPIMQELYRILPKCYSLVEPEDFISELGAKFSPHVVVHAGAVVDTKDLGSANMYNTNVRYTEQLREACDRIGANLIFISSAAVYGNDGHPNNPYGLSKALGEKIVSRARGHVTILRLFNVFGRFEHHKGEMASVPWKIAQAFEKVSKFHLHSLNAERDFIPSSAVVEAITYAVNEMMASGGKRHRVYDVGTGTPTSFDTLVRLIADSKEWLGSKPIPVDLIEMPTELIGRYQFRTQAGDHRAPIVPAGVNYKMLGTVQGIMEAYGTKAK